MTLLAAQPAQPAQRNAFVLPALAPLLVAAAAAALEAATRRRERERQPPGRLIALAPSRRVHVVYHAPPALSNAPCVILEAGANSWSPMWEDVATLLTPIARVLRYDRPGFGFSDPPPLTHVHTVSAAVDDLRATLRISGAAPPYVLVAHSLGALYINVLARRLHPCDVLAVVYVDAASPETVRLLEPVVPTASPPAWLARALGCLGLLRLLAPFLLRPYASAFRGDLKNEAIATWARGDWLLTYTREWTAAVRSINTHDSPESLNFPPGWLGSVPTAVLVPDVYERTQGKAYIRDLQSAVAQYSSNSTVIPVRDCGHFVQLERPDVVVEAIQSVISRAQEQSERFDIVDDQGFSITSA